MLPDLSGTLRELLVLIKEFLAAAQIENPGLEARIFLSHVFGGGSHEIFSKDHLKLDASKQEKLGELLKQKAKGKPTAYLVGHKEFFSRNFFVDENVLIPRPETEELAEWVIAEKSQAESILDMCTGSGCLGITLALECKAAGLVLADLSAGALKVAQKNAKALLPETVHLELLQGDLFEPVSGRQFDLVVSNPPYVLLDEYEELDPEVKDFEPRQALVLPAGLNNRFASGAYSVMKPGARLYIETGPRVIDELSVSLSSAGFVKITHKKDLSGKWRFLSAQS